MALDSVNTEGKKMNRIQLLWQNLKPDERLGLAVFFGLLLFALLASSLAILSQSGVVPPWPMDQSFAQWADLRIGRENGFWVFHYPNLQNSGGITSVLIAGIYKLIVPTRIDNLNWHIRILAMFGYLTASACLILVFLRKSSVRLISLVLVAASGYQFVQPSSELFAAALLCFFLVFVAQKSSVWLASLFLVGYGFCKVELILSSFVLAGYWSLRERDLKRRLLIPVSYFAWFAALLLPSIYINGMQTLSGSRSWEAFKVKYTSLFHPHQLSAPSNDPWAYSHESINKIFPNNDQKIINVIRFYPRLYLDYLSLSLTQSLLNIINAIKFLVVPAFLCFAAPQFPSSRLRFASASLIIVILFGLFPALFMGFVHVRYVFRYFPLIVVVLFGLCLEGKVERPWVRPLIWLAAIATLSLQLIYLPKVFEQAHYL